VGYSETKSGIGVYGQAGGIGLTEVDCGVAGMSSTGKGVLGVTNKGTGTRGECLGKTGLPMHAKGTSDQTGDLQIWQTGNTTRARINKDGWLGIGTSPARSIHLSGNNAVFRMDRDVDSAAFILVRTAFKDFNTVWKTFYVGIDASGVNNGEFFIGDVGTNVSGASTKRLRIYNNGDVWVNKLLTGDIKLANDFIVTEDEKAGIAFKNPKGEKIAMLDEEGNFHIKGKVMEDL
jgi:hypothetical protein